ncbi:MAG TPA: hypothetical protein ENJ82_08270, partial [Bacteroidetes bacterium]|nr:hypothetical protein [Bacteroidota bacterium]
MITRTVLHLLIFLISVSSAFAQVKKEDNHYKKHFIGSTAFVLANLAPNPPNYYQLNYGYRITRNDVISIEAITWEYPGPLGRPYGPDYDNSRSRFPGYVKAFGIGLAYKRFIWKGAYSAIHATAFHQNYMDLNDKKIQSGFQLFNTLRFGYHFNLFKNRMFIEPSFAFTYWPVNT